MPLTLIPFRVRAAALALLAHLAVPAVAMSQDATRSDIPSSASDTVPAHQVAQVGSRLRIFAPSLPPEASRLEGVLTSVDTGPAGPNSLTLQTIRGNLTVPCTSVRKAESQISRRVGWRRRILFISSGAVVGAIVGHVAFTQSKQYFASADPFTPNLVTEPHTSDGGVVALAVLGASLGYLAVRDRAAWQAVAIPHCVNP